jgi:carbonic anhydrase/acetyltransferase-like protein (isoleucine patch superfamily)
VANDTVTGYRDAMAIRSFEGHDPDPGRDGFVDPTAVVIGRVRLGRSVSVWPHTVLRADSDVITVGEATNIQDGSVVHVDAGVPCAIGARVTIGHRAIIHGCVIEDDVLVGMGAIVMNHARIGTGSILGAGALVTERSEIPPGSLVLGAPGRVVRSTTGAERQRILQSAAHYVTLGRRHRSG